MTCSTTPRWTSSTSRHRTCCTGRWHWQRSRPAKSSIAKSRWRRRRPRVSRWRKRLKRPASITQVGFNYLKNPMMALAREIIAGGEIGEIRTFRGVHAEDYMADAAGALDLAARSCRRRWRPGRHRQPHPRHGATTSSGPSSSSWPTCRPRSPRARCGRGPPRRGPVEVDDVARRVRPLCKRRHRHDRGELDRDRPQDAARFRDLRLEGRHRVHPGAIQRTAGVLHGRSGRTARLPHHPGRAGPRALRGLLRGAGPPDRLQRSQGHRSARFSSCRRGRPGEGA